MDDANFDASFAPQSPDLSGYYNNHDPEPVHPQHQQYRCSITPITPFNPTGPQSPFAQAKFFPPQQHSVPQQRQPPTPTTAGIAAAAAPILKHPVFPKRDSNGAGDAEWESMAPSTRKKVKAEVKDDDDYGADVGNGTGNGNVDVKTKFPVARIKRIMQSDEDVGKVAQVTPVVVSKALELFMIDLVTSAATEAKTRSSKRVTAAHLKQAVMTNEKYRDWLGETVSKVPDATTAAAGGGGGGRAAKDEDSDDWEGAPAKKRRGAGRRKKKDDD